MSAGRDEEIDLQVHLPYSPPGSGVVFNHITAPGLCMALLWMLQLLSVFLLFEEPDRINSEEAEDAKTGSKYGSVSDCESVPTNHTKTCSTVLHDISAVFKVILDNMAFPVSPNAFFVEVSQSAYSFLVITVVGYAVLVCIH